MPFRRMCISAIILFFFIISVGTFTYGPAQRRFVTPHKTVTIGHASEIDNLWHSSGVHGRVVVIFSRHLNHQFSAMSFPEMDYLDKAMQHGIVRKAYFIVPDSAWKTVVLEYRGRLEYIVEPIITDTGFMILHEGGRIHVMPLSEYIPELDTEKALVVIDPAVWTQQEQSRIDGFFRTGQLAADLTIVVGKENEH